MVGFEIITHVGSEAQPLYRCNHVLNQMMSHWVVHLTVTNYELTATTSKTQFRVANMDKLKNCISRWKNRIFDKKNCIIFIFLLKGHLCFVYLQTKDYIKFSIQHTEFKLFVIFWLFFLNFCSTKIFILKVYNTIYMPIYPKYQKLDKVYNHSCHWTHQS